MEQSSAENVVNSTQETIVRLSMENAALRYGAGEMSGDIVKMACGLIDEETDADTAIVKVINMVKGKARAPTVSAISTGGSHGAPLSSGVDQAAYDRNKGDMTWLRQNRSEIIKAMFEGKIK